jgi:hypothetical protein
MGGDPYWYAVPYQQDTDKALQELRQREFDAGRYNPVIPFPKFPITASSPAPGRAHPSIDEALEASGEDGTRSILDVAHISSEPDYFAASALGEDQLKAYFGTTQPSRQMVESNTRFRDDVQRGQAVFIVLYENGAPTELFFLGYSFA